MKKDYPPLSMGNFTFYGKWGIGFQNKREAGVSPALQSFFLLGNQVAQVFCFKDQLTILKAASYEVCGKISSQVARNQSGTHWPTIFLKVATGRPRA